MISMILKIIAGAMEGFLGIPLIGGIFILSHLWMPLLFMLAVHIITLVISHFEGRSSPGSILGIITSVIGWIPFVGMVMHLLSAIVLLFDGILSLSRVRKY